jgi:protein-tyrosine sulfotransferase
MNEPIFILSDARTGSTLLRVLLDTHPAICSPGELSLGALCEHLCHAIEATHWESFLEQPVEARTELSLAETRQIVDGILQKYCARKGKRRWCEKTPRNLSSLGTLRAVFPDAQYICLYRHGLDAVHSSMAVHGDLPDGIHWYLDKQGGKAVAAFIHRWCDRADKLLAFEAANAARSLRVRYEDLVTDPGRTLQGILAFLGEEWRPDLVERVFASPHDNGVGDSKIASTTTVRTDRVGAGRRLNVSDAPPELRERLRRTLASLGYDDQPTDIATATPASSRPVRTEVAPLAELFAERLARHRNWLRAPRHEVGVNVRGPGGGAWTLQFNESGAGLSTDAGTPKVTIALDATDLLDAVNGRLTLAELRTKFAMEGAVASIDRPLIDRLVLVLFGDDLRADA